MRIKYVLFGVFTFFITLIIFTGLILIADLHYHNKYLHLHGLNHKGYRGKVVNAKKEEEVRLVMLGGSVVFGYGVKYNETLPSQLENKLQAYCDIVGCNKKITVINLAYNNEGAYAFYNILNDFLYLNSA